MTIELLLRAAQYLELLQKSASDAPLRSDHGYALSAHLKLYSCRQPSKPQSASYKTALQRTGRSMHNEMEKYRRANLRQCLERLKDAMPASATGKATTLQLLKRAKLHITRLEADYRSQEQMRAELMEQQRQLHDYLLQHRRRRRRPRHQQQQQRDDGVVVVKETGTCSGHVTGMAQCLDDMEEDSACNSDGSASSLVMSTSSDNDDVDIMGSASDCDDYSKS